MLLLLAAAASVVVNVTNDSKREEVRGSGFCCSGLRVCGPGFRVRLWGAKPMPQKSFVQLEGHDVGASVFAKIACRVHTSDLVHLNVFSILVTPVFTPITHHLQR